MSSLRRRRAHENRMRIITRDSEIPWRRRWGCTCPSEKCRFKQIRRVKWR